MTPRHPAWFGHMPIGMLPSRAFLEYRLDTQNSQSYYCVNPNFLNFKKLALISRQLA